MKNNFTHSPRVYNSTNDGEPLTSNPMVLALRRGAFLLLLLLLAPVSQAGGISRDEMILQAANWRELYEVYKQVGRTADGVVAGAFTEKASELLADQWPSVGDLQRIVRHDNSFWKFVLANINEAVSADRAKRIESNVVNACPHQQTSALCEQLQKALVTAKRQQPKTPEQTKVSPSNYSGKS